MCVTALLWIAGDTGVVGEYATANIMTKSWFSTLGKGEIAWQNDLQQSSWHHAKHK